MMLALLIALATLLVLTYRGSPYWGWVLAGTVLLVAAHFAQGQPGLVLWSATGVFAALAALFGIEGLRQSMVSGRLLPLMQRALPRLGETERVALEAGTVWWDGELFSGQPDWDALLTLRLPPLSEAERAFLDGPVEQLCRAVDDWEVTQKRDLPEALWEQIREDGFLGLIIPEEHGGKGFSALAHSLIVSRIASRSIPLAVTVMVPNSLGPAELLLHYGTDEQRKRYLPRLASGQEIPCFALTGPEAGSDAAATQSTGVVCRRKIDGEEVLGILLNWRKRYITLAPVATLIGLAFRLQDPDGLLGEVEDLGITCALVPRATPGVSIGRRHDPMGVPFQNGPIEGKNVFVPIDAIIGGPAQAGQGWRMLMESLAAGRSVSLPALSVGAAQLATRVVGAYGTVREQFDTPIGRFEGVEEPLARIGAYTYMMSAARTLTCGALDLGHQPSVISAIVKAYLTDGMRRCVIDAMDIRAGAAIMRGPRNMLARVYQAVPIGITVEGSNILTRSMIIYGQGAIRCHPFVQEEIDAAGTGDLARFDRALFGHIGHATTNAARALLLGISGARLGAHHINPHVAAHVRQLTRLSAAFATASEFAMFTLGGRLKRREKISGRLADCLAWLYLASATLKRYSDDWQRADDLPFVNWICQHAIFEIQTALEGICDNLDNRPAATLLRLLVLPPGSRVSPPGDRLGSTIARALLEDREERERLTADIHVPEETEVGLGALERALDEAVEALAVERRLRDAVRAGRLDKAPGLALAQAGLEAGEITQREYDQIAAADACRNEVVQVDSFTQRQYSRLRG